jgi:hypothetical protein
MYEHVLFACNRMLFVRSGCGDSMHHACAAFMQVCARRVVLVPMQ